MSAQTREYLRQFISASNKFINQIQVGGNENYENVTTRLCAAALWKLIPDETPESVPGSPFKIIRPIMFNSAVDGHLFGPYTAARTAAEAMLNALGIERTVNPTSAMPIPAVDPEKLSSLSKAITRLKNTLEDKSVELGNKETDDYVSTKKKKIKKGRKPKFDPKEDSKVFTNVEASGLTPKQYANQMGASYQEVMAACKRHRARLRRSDTN